MRILQIIVLALIAAAAIAAPRNKREELLPGIFSVKCADTTYGCCPDGVTARYAPELNLPCPSKRANYNYVIR
ncbi:hypothetical protein PoB_003915900 [Plakobranchus ocellatus]|uniref:Uncharacterized protein n=1 Tax=Plakobranchus ocellatus TaxID=259542 RepID=A0AAV4B1U0_9GAST|nr:hypothetical protein PoB_003915900 [Plakobranchus ocellatus]